MDIRSNRLVGLAHVIYIELFQKQALKISIRKIGIPLQIHVFFLCEVKFKGLHFTDMFSS